jgi:hypothetical protein
MNEAINDGDFSKADMLLEMASVEYDKCKSCAAMPEDNRKKSFGELNHMLECELTRLFKEDRNALSECMSLIKEDKNLRSMFRFISSLRKFDGNGDARSYVNESIDLVSGSIDRKSVKESVEKLADALSRNEIGDMEINESLAEFYRNCEKVLSEKKKIQNLTEYSKAVDGIVEYLNENKGKMNESVMPNGVVYEDVMAMACNLSESDQRLVDDIMSFKRSIDEQKKKALFEKLKGDCIKLAEKSMQKDLSEQEASSMQTILERINEKEYNGSTIVEDIAKMLEIRDILSEK